MAGGETKMIEEAPAPVLDAHPQDHPEDLLDLARNGAIGDAQWQTLRRHVDVCFPCATQFRLSGIATEGSPPSPSQTHLERVSVRRTLQRIAVSAEVPRRSRVRRLLPIGAATLLLSGTALAASWWTSRRGPGVTLGVSSGATARPAPLERPHGPSAPHPLAAAVGSAGVVPARDPAPRPIEGRARPALPSAGDLFARARTLRLEGNTEGALALYRRLQQSHPDSRESLLSYLVVGRLWLERDRPELAARQFSLFLRVGGDGTEEALVGRATALGRLGRSAEEAADWAALLAGHPNAVYKNRAHQRLAELKNQTSSAHSSPGVP
ncbi:MAG: hypothetical protein ABUL77_04170 [Bacteroidota bacterium]